MDINERAVLLDRQQRINARLEEIGKTLKERLISDRRAQELLSERDALYRHLSVTTKALSSARVRPARDAQAARRRNRLVEMREREAREVIENHIRRCEERGEFAQARIWRLDLLGLRERIEKQFA